MSDIDTVSTGPLSSDSDVHLCAFRAEDYGEPCLREAEWVVVWGGDESTAVDICEDHLGFVTSGAIDYVIYPVPEYKADLEGVCSSDLDVVGEGPAMHTLSTLEAFTCPRRIQMTDGYTEPHQDFWEFRDFEHFQRCSFCGSVRADDAVGLVRTGWKIVLTDKPHKVLLIPFAGDAEYYDGRVYKFYLQHIERDEQRRWFR